MLLKVSKKELGVFLKEIKNPQIQTDIYIRKQKKPCLGNYHLNPNNVSTIKIGNTGYCIPSKTRDMEFYIIYKNQSSRKIVFYGQRENFNREFVELIEGLGISCGPKSL
jgi:hypothetical protein